MIVHDNNCYSLEFQENRYKITFLTSGTTALDEIYYNVRDAANLGTGHGLYIGKTGHTLYFKSLKAGDNITLASSYTGITISSVGGGSNTTASNGLSKVGDDIRLGGAITGNTFITGTTAELEINLDAGRVFFGVQSPAGPTLNLSSTNGLNFYTDGFAILTSGDNVEVSAINNATLNSVGITSVSSANQIKITNLSNELDFYTTGVTFTDNKAIKTGIRYGGDYSSTFVDNSLVTKKYVVNNIPDGANGLTKFENIIKLGGIVNETTSLRLNAAFSIVDERLSSSRSGIVYGGNYSTGFTKYSLVDKNYVTGITSSLGSSTTASNGLSKVGSDIRLGGNLSTGNTTIIGSEGEFTLINDYGGFTLGDVNYLYSNVDGAFRYADDYSATFVDRSIVDKRFVLDSISTGRTTFQNNGSNLTKRLTVNVHNGLTANDASSKTNLKLGGTLTESTTFGGNQSVSFGIDSNRISSFQVQTSGGVILGGLNSFSISAGNSNSASSGYTRILADAAGEVKMVTNTDILNGSIGGLLLQTNIKTGSGSIANGAGIPIKFSVLGVNGNPEIRYQLEDVTASAERGKFSFLLHRGGSVSSVAELDRNGWKYTSDVSSGFTIYSLVDKNWVTGRTSTFASKVTFTPNATNAGLNVGSVSSAPSSLVVGDIFYNSSTGNYSVQNLFGTANIAVTGAGALINNAVPYMTSATTIPYLQQSANFTFNNSTNTLSASNISGGIITSTSATQAGIRFNNVSSDPASLSNGYSWYNSTSHEFKMRISGVTESIATKSFVTGSTASQFVSIKTVGGDYTLLSSDNNKVIEITGNTNTTVTVPNTLSTGFQVTISNLKSSNTVTIVAGSGSTLQLAGTILSSQYSACSLYKHGSSIRGFGNLS